MLGLRRGIYPNYKDVEVLYSLCLPYDLADHRHSRYHRRRWTEISVNDTHDHRNPFRFA